MVGDEYRICPYRSRAKIEAGSGIHTLKHFISEVHALDTNQLQSDAR